MKERIRDRYEKDLGWNRQFDNVSTMKHNPKFEQYCDRNVYTKQWWDEYYQCCNLIETIVTCNEISEDTYRSYEQHFTTSVKVFNFIEKNKYIADPIKEDLNLCTGGLHEAWKYIWLIKNKPEKVFRPENPKGFLRIILLELEEIEKEELQCL